MRDSHAFTLAQLESFVHLDHAFQFDVVTKKGKYQWISEVLKRFGYHCFKRKQKKEKMIVCAYIKKVTGISKAQLKRLIKKHKKAKTLVPNYSHNKKNGFPKKYGALDIARLIETDIAHGHLSGPATRNILTREYHHYHQESYKNIAEISSSHIYAIRNENRQYNSSGAKWVAHTRATPVPIGVRAKPRPQGRPGYLRVDTVHSGDLLGAKGAYHINIVDEVTQWEMIATVEAISERFLTPVIEELLTIYPFMIQEFHSDNGSEFINHVVAKLLAKLYIRFTKSRARHSNDNALVESKNGAIIRKLYGHNHIPAAHAERINAFNRQYVNVYLNYHRPCGFAEDYVDASGKIRKRYRQWMTPYEKLKSLENAMQYLKPGTTFETLDKIAQAHSDNQFAQMMNKAKVELFTTLRHS